MNRILSLAFWLFSAFALTQPVFAQVVVSGTHVLMSGTHPVFTTAGTGGSAPAFVQGIVGSWNAGATTGTASFGVLPGTGHAVLVVVNGYIGGTPQSLTSVTDNQSGNTYIKIWQIEDPVNSQDNELWWCSSITAPSGTFTVTAHASSGYNFLVKVIEVKNITTLDRTTTITTAGGATVNVTAVSPGANATASNFVFAALTLQYNGTTDPTLTHPPTTTNSDTYTDFGYQNGTGFATYIVSDTGYYTAGGSETSNATWAWANTGFASAAGIATFH